MKSVTTLLFVLYSNYKIINEFTQHEHAHIVSY